MEEIVIVMDLEKTTKNKVLYKSAEQGVFVDNVYINKSAFNGSEPPTQVVVKIGIKS